MFGKAVKVRHCPATVSAARQAIVFVSQPDEAGKSTIKPLGAFKAGSWEGG
jgi:hypothetical protein